MIVIIRLGERRVINTFTDTMGRTWVGYDPSRSDVELWAQNRGRYAFAESRLDEVTWAALSFRGEVKVVASVTGWERFEDLERGVTKRALIGEVVGPGDPAYAALRRFPVPRARSPFTYVREEEVGLAPVDRNAGRPPGVGAVQGWQSDPVRREKVEDAAQDRLMKHYEAAGWSVRDTRFGNPYDAVAWRDGQVLFLEAKGTETRGQAVIVTRGEVEHARAHRGECVLGVLSEIVFDAHGDVDPDSGVFRVMPWDPDTGELVVTGYEWQFPEVVQTEEGPK